MDPNPTHIVLSGRVAINSGLGAENVPKEHFAFLERGQPPYFCKKTRCIAIYPTGIVKWVYLPHVGGWPEPRMAWCRCVDLNPPVGTITIEKIDYYFITTNHLYCTLADGYFVRKLLTEAHMYSSWRQPRGPVVFFRQDRARQIMELTDNDLKIITNFAEPISEVKITRPSSQSFISDQIKLVPSPTVPVSKVPPEGSLFVGIDQFLQNSSPSKKDEAVISYKS